MSNALFEVDCLAKPVKPEFGGDGRGKPKISVEFEILDGEYKGHRVPYSGKLDEKSIKFTKRDMIALGWQGTDVRTFVADVTKESKPITITTRIAEWDKRDGSEPRRWTTVGRIHAAQPLTQLESDRVADVNSWFASAGSLDSQSNGTHNDDSEVPF